MIEKNDTHILNREKKAHDLINETKLLNIARLAKLLIEIYGFNEPFNKIGKREGQEVEFYFPSLNGYLTFVLSKNIDNFEPRKGRSINPISCVTINVKRNDVVRVVSAIVRTKNNIFGILKFFLKYVITRKIKISGSLGAILKLLRCIAIGKREMYKFKNKGEKR